MTSVHEAMLNAQFNFGKIEKMLPILKSHPIYLIAKNQLDNALKSIDEGKGLNDEMEDVF